MAKMLNIMSNEEFEKRYYECQVEEQLEDVEEAMNKAIKERLERKEEYNDDVAICGVHLNMLMEGEVAKQLREKGWNPIKHGKVNGKFVYEIYKLKTIARK